METLLPFHAERLLFSVIGIPVHSGIGNYFLVLDNGVLNHSHPSISIFSVIVMNRKIHPTAQNNTVIISEGLVIMRSFQCIFALSTEKLYQITKYKSEVIAPKSGMKQFFNPTFGIKKKSSG